MVGEFFKSEAEYEAMTLEELQQYPVAQLKLILQRVFGLDSVVYFLDRAQKERYITQPDQRPVVLAEGAGKRDVHREANRENRVRPRGSVEERMLEETKDRLYRLVSILRAPGTVDAFTGRVIRDVYVIEDMADGTQFSIARGSARKLQEWGRLEGFVVTQGRRSVAHSAGEKALADYFEDPEQVSGAPAKVAAPKAPDSVEPAPTTIGDQELEDLLNSLPS